jgi:hypothetical protein
MRRTLAGEDRELVRTYTIVTSSVWTVLSIVAFLFHAAIVAFSVYTFMITKNETTTHSCNTKAIRIMIITLCALYVYYALSALLQFGLSIAGNGSLYSLY